MTKKIFITNLPQIKIIKVKCDKCGYAVDVPLDHPGAIPEGCTKCTVLFTSAAIAKLLQAILDLLRDAWPEMAGTAGYE